MQNTADNLAMLTRTKAISGKASRELAGSAHPARFSATLPQVGDQQARPRQATSAAPARRIGVAQIGQKSWSNLRAGSCWSWLALQDRGKETVGTVPMRQQAQLIPPLHRRSLLPRQHLGGRTTPNSGCAPRKAATIASFSAASRLQVA